MVEHELAVLHCPLISFWCLSTQSVVESSATSAVGAANVGVFPMSYSSAPPVRLIRSQPILLLVMQSLPSPRHQTCLGGQSPCAPSSLHLLGYLAEQEQLATGRLDTKCRVQALPTLVQQV